MDKCFKVIVPCKPRKVRGSWISAVSYPSSSQPLYTREEAITVLKKLTHSDMDEQSEPWAEGPSERFTLHFPDELLPA
jgi:hypothetical protein